MSSLERTIRILIGRVEEKLWDSATSVDILAPNGDIIGSEVTTCHRVNDGYIKYTLKDYESGVPINPSFTIIMMDGDSVALGIRLEFKQKQYYPISDMEIESIYIIGRDSTMLDDIPVEISKKAENMIMTAVIEL